MRTDARIDELLRSALRSSETPAKELLQEIKYKSFKEEPMRKAKMTNPLRTMIAAALAVALITATAFAAWYFLKPSDVANLFEDSALSAAFESESAVAINQSVTSGGYTFTLLAMVSGKDLSDYQHFSDGEIRSDRTYAVTAIQKADGSPMPTTRDDEYGNPSFYVSPYIKGLKPWQFNAHTMNGGYSEIVVDGIMYRILDCDEITMFADRGLYLGINTGSFYSSQAFIFDEQTGELKVNPDFSESSVVFNLPIDKSLADPEKAQAYLDSMWDEEDAPPSDARQTDEEADFSAVLTENGSISKQVMTYDALKKWIDDTLAETQKMVDGGEYSEANLELDRQGYAEKLKDIENGNTVTLYTYADGSYSLATTYPDSGFDVDVDASGVLIIKN